MNQCVPYFSRLCRHSAGESFRSWYRCENVLFLCLWMNAFTFSISLCLLTLVTPHFFFVLEVIHSDQDHDHLFTCLDESVVIRSPPSEWATAATCCPSEGGLQTAPAPGQGASQTGCSRTPSESFFHRLTKKPRVNSVCVWAGGSWATFQFTTKPCTRSKGQHKQLTQATNWCSCKLNKIFTNMLELIIDPQRRKVQLKFHLCQHEVLQSYWG